MQLDYLPFFHLVKSDTQLSVEDLASRYDFSYPWVIPVATADGRPLRPPYKPKVLHKNGYPTVSYRKRSLGITMRVPVHQVIAFQKYGEVIFTEGVLCRHKDNDKLNFRQGNILIGTPKDNFRDNGPEWAARLKGELNRKAVKESVKVTRKFCLQEVRDIRGSCDTHVYTAEMYGVAASTIGRIKRKDTYADVI